MYMKKFLLLSAILIFPLLAFAQDIIFNETFGTTQLTRGTCTSVTVPGTAEAGKYDPQKNELFVDHLWSEGSHTWNTGISYSQTSVATANPGACDDTGTTMNIRTNNPSSFTGASGDGNLYFNANVINSFTISGINTSNFDNPTLSFGIYGKNKVDVTLLKLQYDSGSGLTDLGTTQIAALTTTKATWMTVSNLVLPTAQNLRLTFSTPTTNSTNLVLGVAQPIEIRIDDIKITGTSKSTLIHSTNSDNRKIIAINDVITLNGFNDGNIEIYNMQGKQVYTSFIEKIIQPQLAKGLYIVRIGDFRQKISL
jgi:hypothetical protein